MQTHVHILKGDITEMAVDAIVNAANTDLILGGGVAGAIRRKGGPFIQEDCDRIGRIALGAAVVTTAGNLKALYVIHAASMHQGGQATAQSLQHAVRESLERAEEKALRSIAFPAVGAGIAGYPIARCAEIMLKEVFHHLETRTTLENVYFVLYDDAALEVFKAAFENVAGRPAGVSPPVNL